MTDKKDEYLFFWNGIYSQWYPSEFHDFAGRNFNCAEQYMMASKAALFKDIDIYGQIMNTTSPKEQKALGRQVKNFDMDEWKEHAIDIVTMGNYFKFTQNEELFAQLKSTGAKHIVEASPYDKLWGIGRAEDYPDIENQENWDGKNWLGVCIMRVRIMLFGTRPDHKGALAP